MKTLKIDHHIKADVLIIGGGFSGLWAAISAREHVENVVLVDKGPADWGGLGTSSGGDFQCVQDTTSTMWSITMTACVIRSLSRTS